MATWDDIKRGIFAGESGGDYNALFGYQNREGGKFSNTDLQNMTVNEAIEFSNPQGEYGQWVKQELARLGQKPRVATPMGAYQIVGTTLRGAKDDLGLTGDEKMTPELQDTLGKHIYNKQGTGAWEGYKGPVREGQEPPNLSYGAKAPAMGDISLPGNQAARDNPLMKYAGGMEISAELMSQGMSDMNVDMNEMFNMTGRLIDNPRAKIGLDENNVPRPQLGMPAGTPAAGNPTLPNGQNILPTPAGTPPTVSTSSGAGGAGPAPTNPAAAAAPQSFTDRALSKLFPNMEDPAMRRQGGSDVLAALSMGLGQMSGGSNVDLSPVLNRMQVRQAEAGRLAQDAQQAEADNQFKKANLGIAQQNADTATAKAAASVRSEQAKMDGYSFTPEEIAVFASNPAYAGLAAQLDHKDPAVRQKAYEEIAGVQREQAKEAIEAGEADPQAQANMAAAYEAALDPNATPQQRVATAAALSNEQLDRFVKLPGVDPTAGIQDAEAYMNGTPEYRETVDRMKRLTAGTPTDENMDRTFRNQYGQDLFKQYAKNVENASVIDAPLNTVLAGQEDLIREGASDDDLTRMFNDTVGAGIRSVSSMLGRSVTADQFMQEQFNIDSDKLAQLDNAEKTLLFTIGQQMLAKQGSVSDGERKMAADAILSANGNPEAKMRAIAHLQVANSMDKAIYDYYKENASPAFQNSMELEQEINTMFRNLSVPLGSALSEHYTFDNAYGLSENSAHTKLLDQIVIEQADGFEGPTPATDEYYKRTSPLMTDEVARRVGKYLPRRIEYYKKEDPETGKMIFVPMPRR